jgi:hypothetical protein
MIEVEAVVVEEEEEEEEDDEEVPLDPSGVCFGVMETK